MSMDQDSPIADRLREALRLRGRTPNWLQRQLTQQGVPGSSGASVSRYVRGGSTPPVDFLRAAARMLDVFEPWLISGYGHPDQRLSDPAPNQGREGAPHVRTEDGQDLAQRITDRFYRFPELQEGTRLAVLELLDRCSRGTPEQADSPELARQLGAALAAPLRALNLDDPSSPPTDRLDRYVLAACAAVSWLVPEPAPRGPARKRRATST